MLLHVLSRTAACPLIDRVVLATTLDPSDDAVAALGAAAGFDVHRGPIDDVLARYAEASARWPSEWVVRVTGDNPFVDPEILSQEIALARRGGHDYVAARGYPIGTFGEVVKRKALLAAHERATDHEDREHVTLYLKKHLGAFDVAWLVPAQPLPGYRLTVDEPADFELAQTLLQQLPADPRLKDVLEALRLEPALAAKNRHVKQAVPFFPRDPP